MTITNGPNTRLHLTQAAHGLRTGTTSSPSTAESPGSRLRRPRDGTRREGQPSDEVRQGFRHREAVRPEGRAAPFLDDLFQGGGPQT
jgi:hypothetical protein